MNEFVEECRREWKRLHVPDPVADEMAADLAADLAEAEAEGASAEDVLGPDALDPRSFAAVWAAERAVIGGPSRSRHRRSSIPAAFAVLALVAIVGAVLLIRASAPERRGLLVPASGLLSRASGPEARIILSPLPPAEKRLASGSVWVSSDDVRSFVLDTHGSGSETRTIGAVLSAVSLAAIVLLAIASLWLARGRRSRDPGAG
jgi:hypothetical protein